MEWFKLKVMFTISSEVGHVIDDEDEDPLLKRIRLEQAGLEQYETEWAYFNIVSDPIMHLMAGAYLPKDAKNKKSYTLVVFESGNSVTAVGKPEDIYKELVLFIESNPDTTHGKKEDE
jgi:hypothetical protein